MKGYINVLDITEGMRRFTLKSHIISFVRLSALTELTERFFVVLSVASSHAFFKFLHVVSKGAKLFRICLRTQKLLHTFMQMQRLAIAKQSRNENATE